jgi:excisionase family DNA binding protein
MSELGTLLTVADVRRELRVGTSTIYRWLASGTLESVKIGAARRITRASVERLIESCRHHVA